MWIENSNTGELYPNVNEEKIDIREYNPNINQLKQAKMREAKQKDKENKEADRLIASVNFNIPEWKEISEWKVDFTIADILWNIDIDNDKLTINDKVYNITMPSWADLVWITVLDWNIKIKWKLWWLSGSWNVSDEVFKKEIIKLSSHDIKKDIIHTKSWDLILSKL